MTFFDEKRYKNGSETETEAEVRAIFALNIILHLHHKCQT